MENYEFESFIKDIVLNREVDNMLLEKIKIILEKYKREDVILSVYTLSSWLPNNRASYFKLYILNNILISMEEKEYDSKLEIDSYEKFIIFCRELIEIIPQFEFIEDYVFENELGEIKYFFEDKNYSVFGMGVYSNLYEYYPLFQVLYSYLPKNENYKNDFKNILDYLDKVIKIISIGNSRKEIDRGNFEIPSYEYWENIYKNFDKIQECCSNQISIIIDFETSKVSKNIEEIESSWEECIPLPLSLKYKEKNFPVFSRELVINLLFYYKEKIRSLINDKDFYRSLKIGIADYILNRINNNSLYLLQIYNLNSKKIIGSIIYDFGFLVEDDLYLFFTTEISDDLYLEKILNKEKEKIFQNNFTFISYFEGEVISLRKKIKNIKFYKIIVKLSPDNEIIFSKNIEIITIQELFYIFDEIEELSEYKNYEIFLEKCKNFFLVDRINYFSAFKMAKGELIKGAENYNKIALDPNMAEEYRCESLKKREKLLKYMRYGHPKNWKIKNIENKIETYNILTNDFSECIEIDKKIIFISLMKVHFIEELTMENKDLIFNIISMIQKYFVLFKDLLKNDFLFSEKENILIKIFPSSLLDKKDFIHLNHLKNKKIFNSDCSLIKEMYIVRVVIDIKNFKKEFLKAPNCILETKLFLEIIKNLVCKNIYIEILKQVSELEYKESEFKLIEIRSLIPNREVYFEFIAEEEYFIKARKEIAILLEKEKIEIGEYKGKDILNILMKIREILNKKIEYELSQYSEEIIQYILEILDDIFFSNGAVVESYNQSECYRNSNNYIEREKIFRENYKIFIFILENKLYQNIYGGKKITENNIKYLYALVKWIINVYTSIEVVYYSVNKNLKLIIEENKLFTIEIINEKNIEDWENYIMKLIYSNTDIGDVVSEEEKKSFFEELDRTFLKKLQFSFSKLIEKLYLLANYDKSEEKVIKFTKKELINAIKSEDSEEEILNIIQELILESKYLGSILEGENLRDKGFIPYDEINKRPYRLQVKPLIKLNDIYYFSREICKRTINVFLRHISNGKLPYRSKYREIQDVMDKYAKKIQNNIVDKAFEILKENGYKIIYKEVDLRKLDKNGNHPLLEKLGDYDLLVFDIKNNIILNIECKYISQDFCAKDLKNTMEKLFGKNENDKSYIRQVLKRQKYLVENIEKIANNLNFEFQSKIRVIPIFLAYTSNIFLKNPLIESDIICITLNEFESYLKSL